MDNLAVSFLSVFDLNYWELSRAAGIVAYLFLWLAIFSGLLSKTKMLQALGLAPWFMAVHHKSARLGLYFALFHPLMLLYDNYIKFTLADLLIPFHSTYRPLYMSLGIFALYGMVFIITSPYFLRGRAFGYWHLLTYPTYFFALWHGLSIGTDRSAVWLQGVYWITGSLIVYVSLYRLALGIKARRKPAKA